MNPRQALLLFAFLVAYVGCIKVEYAYIGLGSYEDHDTSVSISFFTFTIPQNTSYQPIVHYGVMSQKLDQKSNIGKTKSYNTDKGFVHSVVLKDLKPNTKYYYRCGDEKFGFSGEYSFITTNGNPNEILFLGDMGVLRSGNVMQRIKEFIDDNFSKNQSSLVLHVGDIAYADDYPELYEKIFNHWFDLMQGIMPRAPYMVCPGNHDVGCKFPICDPHNQNFRAYNVRFPMLPANNMNHSMFYSFNYGSIHVVSISTETDFPNAPFSPTFGDQIAWLKSDLEKANKNRHLTPWIVVMGHRPM